MYLVVTTKWCKEHIDRLESSVVAQIPRDTLTEEQIRQAVTGLAPEQRVIVRDMKMNCATTHTYTW